MIQKVILPTKVCNANFRYFTGTGLMILSNRNSGLGRSRSRLRLTEESSDDEINRIIRQRQKKLQKSR